MTYTTIDDEAAAALGITESGTNEHVGVHVERTQRGWMLEGGRTEFKRLASDLHAQARAKGQHTKQGAACGRAMGHVVEAMQYRDAPAGLGHYDRREKEKEYRLGPERRPISRPLAPCRAALIVIHGNAPGTWLPLHYGRMVLGRSSKASLLVDDDSVSRRHCEIKLQGERCRVTDLGSTNGTIVNHALVEFGILRAGDCLQVGRTKLKLLSGNELERHRLEALCGMVTRDAPTDLFNERYFQDLLERETGRSRRHGTALCLILGDLDDFERTADTFGPTVGDAVLHTVGEVVRASARPYDVPGVIHDHRFAMLLPGAGLADALATAEKIRLAVREVDVEYKGCPVPMTMSLGVARWMPEMERAEELMNAATVMLEKAKSHGRDRICG